MDMRWRHGSVRQVEEALVALGTNNLPLLVKRVAYDPGKDILYRSLFPLSRLTRSRHMRDIARRRLDLADDAHAEFYWLGPKAAPAIPHLARIAEHGGEHPSRRAMAILMSLGDEGVAIVASRAAHGDVETRRYAVGLLSQGESRVAYSAMANALSDPDPFVRSLASNFTYHRPPP
jgi:hypothetical protein